MNVKKTVAMVMVVTLLSKIIGFLRDIILAYFYGASSISDAFLISLVIPSVIFSFIGGSIATGYIPMYSNIESKYGGREADKFTNHLISIIICIVAMIFIICIFFTEPLVKIFASGFEGDTLKLAVDFTRITILSVFFTSIVYIFSGYLQIKGNYLAPSLVGLPLNFVLIAAIVLSSVLSIYMLPVGKIVAALFQLLFLFVFVYKCGFKCKLTIDLKSEHIRKTGLLAIPIILGTSVEQINKLVDRTLASNIVVGGISALNYGNQLILFVQGLFVSSISFVYYPIIAKMAANKDIFGLKRSVSQIIVVISVILVPATVGLVILAEPIINIMFGRGAFTNQAIDLTSTALVFYSIGLLGYSIREVLNKVFYSIQDTKTPMIYGAIAMTLNIILNIILSRYLGIGGLALATSISGVVCSLLLFSHLRRKMGYLRLRKSLVTLIKIMTISILMGSITKYTYEFFIEISMHVALLLSIIFSVLFYFACIYFMKIEEVDMFIRELVKRKKQGMIH